MQVVNKSLVVSHSDALLSNKSNGLLQ